MKIIDLLNKIANGEEVPKKIIYRNTIFTYYNETKQYYTNSCIETTLTESLRGYLLNFDRLNDEVEILEEEEKKIPEIIHWHEENGVGNVDDAFYVDVNDKSQYVDSEYDSWEMTVILKINEIIDYLESKEKGE